MSTRIFFNGQEYPGPEAMPADVRKAYEEALARLAEDKNQNGVPDVLEGFQPSLGTIKSSMVINGRTVNGLDDIPAPLRGLVRSALRSAIGDPPSSSPPKNPELLQTLDSVRNRLASVLQFVSAAVAGAILVVGWSVIRHMDAGSRSQGGTVFIAIAMGVGLLWALGMFVNASRRR